MDTNTELTPLVSIVMCAYNRATLLPIAIESALRQDYRNFELLILDDASTDNTKEVVQSYATDARIRYIRNEKNLGLAQNRNKGLQESKGIYLAILDSDDYWIDTSKLSKQVTFLQNNPTCGVVGTFGNIINDQNNIIGKLTYELTDEDIRKRILSRHQFLHSSALFRKEIMVKVGGYDNTMAPSEDYELILNIGRFSTFANLDFFSTNYRIHSGNSSSNEKKKRLHHAQLHLAVIKKYKKNYPGFTKALFKAYLRILTRL